MSPPPMRRVPNTRAATSRSTAGRITAVGAGPAPDRPYARAHRRPRAAGDAGAGQHPPPPLPVDHPRLRHRRHAVRVADHAVPGVGAARRRARARLGRAPNLAWMALTGCTTSTDHHYVFPRGGGDLLEAEITAAPQVGLRFHPTRGSMNLGESAGGLPPDAVVEDHDAILAATEAAIDALARPGAARRWCGSRVAPCSPFSVTAELMRDSRRWPAARACGCTRTSPRPLDEEEFCRETFGARPPSTSRTSAGSATTCGSRTACTSRTPRSPGSPPPAPGWRTARRPTPARAGHRADAGAARRRRAGRARGGRVGVQRVRPDGRRAAPGAARRPVPRGPLALTARRPAGGHERRRALPRAGATSWARSRSASSPTSRSGGWTGWRAAASPTRSCTLVFGAPTLAHLFVGGSAVVADGELRTADAEALAAAAGRRRPPGSPSLHSRRRVHPPDGEVSDPGRRVSEPSARTKTSAVTRTKTRHRENEDSPSRERGHAVARSETRRRGGRGHRAQELGDLGDGGASGGGLGRPVAAERDAAGPLRVGG